MPRNTVVVDFVSETKTTAETLDAASEPEIRFAGGAGARLSPRLGDTAVHLEVLESLRRAHKPVYVEIEPESGLIVSLLIPLIAKIVALRATERGDLEVDLHPSHARHVLRREGEDFAPLQEALLSLAQRDSWMLVTENERQEIIDVRPYPGDDFLGKDLPGPLLRGLRRFKSLALYRAWRWLTGWFCICCFPFRRCISMSQAVALFNMLAARSCNPLTASAPCVPFLYPDDGCWGRAHEMCRLMLAQGVTPAKVWIQGQLRAATRNNPNCAVYWGWHVAPTLCVRDLYCHVVTYVIDPSLFTGPVTEATWKSVQGDPNATLTQSAWSLFMLFSGETDPTYAKTNQVLDTYRNRLRLRSAGPSGPPPYAYCP